MGADNKKRLRRDDPKTAADVERELDELARERAAANTAFIAAAGERQRMLLDATDDEINAFDRKTDALRLTIDRCDARKKALEAELDDFRGAAREARWQDFKARHLPAARDAAIALRTALEALDVMVRIDTEARMAGFERQVGDCFALPQRIAGADAVALLERAVGEEAGKKTTTLEPPAPVTAPVKAALTAPPPIAPAVAAPPTRPPPRQRVIQPAAEGRERLDVLRDGLEIDGTRFRRRRRRRGGARPGRAVAEKRQRRSPSGRRRMTADGFLEHQRRKRAVAKLREAVDELDEILVEMQGHLSKAVHHLRAIERGPDAPLVALAPRGTLQ